MRKSITLSLLSLCIGGAVAAGQTAASPTSPATSPAGPSASDNEAPQASPSKGQQYAAAMKALELIRQVSDVLDGVKDKASADAAVPKMQELRGKLLQLKESVETGALADAKEPTQEESNKAFVEFITVAQRLQKLLEGLKANDFYGSTELKSVMQDGSVMQVPEGGAE